MSWSYQRTESEFAVLPEGDYRIRVKSAEKKVSKTGRDMLELQFAVSGWNTTLYHYIVFMEDHPEITNRNLTNFFDSFKAIQEGDFNLSHWVGQVGACRVKHEEYKGNPTARLHYFIRADKQDKLPPWREPTGTSTSAAPAAPVRHEEVDENGFIKIDDNINEEIPFV